VRKVLGASIISITKMLSREFLIMVLLSCLIALPIAYYISDDMLSSYTYRIQITWDIFLIAGSGAFVLTLLTVSYQSIKAAMVNPVRSLKDE
ncbi:MAG: ABC transporter permease, partial [Sphingobacterium sp.]